MGSAVSGARSGTPVVYETDAVADENVVADRHALANEAMRRDLAAAPDNGAALNFDEGADLGVVADATVVEIHEIEPTYVLTDTHISDNVAFRDE